MGFFDDQYRGRQAVASFCTEEDGHQHENGNRNKDGPGIDSDTLSIHVVLDDTAVNGVHEASYQIEKAQERPGKSFRSVGFVREIGNDGEYCEHKCSNTESEIKGGIAQHPSVGLPIDVEMGRHPKW